MTETDHIVQALQSAATEAERIAPPTEGAWQHIQRRAARRRRRHWIGRIAAIAVPLVAAGGLATGAVEAYAPGSRPQQVVVPPPVTTVVVPTTVPTRITVPQTTPPTTATRPHVKTATVAGASLTSVPWAGVTYPFQCGTTLQGPVGYRVVQVAYPRPAPGRTLAIVMVECNSGAGTPPVELLAYDRASSRLAPHLAQTLIAVSARYQASRFTASGASVTVAISGFSTTAVPNCCPDVHMTLTWHWTASGYQPGA